MILYCINPNFSGLSNSTRQIVYALLTRAPVVGGASTPLPLDLHVLGLPLAFILSQDQTLHRIILNNNFIQLKALSKKFSGIFNLV